MNLYSKTYKGQGAQITCPRGFLMGPTDAGCRADTHTPEPKKKIKPVPPAISRKTEKSKKEGRGEVNKEKVHGGR